MIQFNKKCALIVYIFSVIFVFSTAKSNETKEKEYTLSPKTEKIFGYSKVGLGVVLMLGLRYPIKSVFNNFSNNESIGSLMVGGYIAKLAALAALEAGSVWLMVDGIGSIIEAYNRERYSYVK